MPFTFIIEDPSGNSHVQNPSAPTRDHYCKKTHWIRTKEEYETMGYPVDQATLAANDDKLKLQDPNAEKMPITDFKNGKRQTKQEQEELLEKAKKHANPVT